MAFYFVNDGTVDVAVSFQEDEGQGQAAFLALWASAISQTDASGGSRPNLVSGAASVDIARFSDGYTGNDLEANYVAGTLAVDIEIPWFQNDEPLVTINGTATLVDSDDMLTAALSSAMAAAGTLQDVNDTLAGSLVASIAFNGAISEENDSLAALLSTAAAINGNLSDDPDTLIATMAGPVPLNGTVIDGNDYLVGDITTIVPPTTGRDGSGGGGRWRRVYYEDFENVRKVIKQPKKKKTRKKIAAQVKRAIEPLEIKAQYLAVDLSPVQTAIEQFESNIINYETMMFEIEELIDEMAAKRRDRNRKIAIAMLMAQ